MGLIEGLVRTLQGTVRTVKHRLILALLESKSNRYPGEVKEVGSADGPNDHFPSEHGQEDYILAVLTQREIDTVVDGLERARIGMSSAEFDGRYGKVYRKFYMIDNEDDNTEYRVK